MATNWGAFAGGLAAGIEKGQQLHRMKQLTDLAVKRETRDAELHELKTSQYRNQLQAYQNLAALVDEFGPKPVSTPSQAVNGVLPTTEQPTAVEQPTGVRIMDTADHFGPSEAPAPFASLGSGRVVNLPSRLPARLGAKPAQSAAASPDAAIDTALDKLATENNLGPEETQQLRERVGMGMNNEKIGMGLWRNPSLFKNPEFLNRASRLFLDAGLPEGIKWLERGAQAVDERGIDALRLLIGGDAQGAETTFNAGGQIKIQPGTLKDAGNGRWSFTLADGQQQTIDPRQMLRSFLSPKEFFNLELGERKADAEIQTRRDTVAARDRQLTEQERHNRATEATAARNADLRLELARIRSERGANATTALERNVEFLVENKIASDPLDAFNKLRTSMEKPEEDAILSVASMLMRGPGYAGRDGWNRATRDATAMVRSVKGQKPDDGDTGAGRPGGTGGGPKSYTVRGKTFTETDIDATAKKYGMSPEQVKQQLGIR